MSSSEVSALTLKTVPPKKYVQVLIVKVEVF